MKKLLLFLLLATAAKAQTSFPVVQGNIAATSLNCSTAFSCVWQSNLASNASTTSIAISGTFTATLLVEESNNGGQTWSTAATLSVAGTTTYSTNGFTDIRVRCSAYTSGTASITINTGLLQIQSVVSGSGGGGIAAVTSLPATCSPGVTAPVNLSVNGVGYGTFICSATNIWTPENPAQNISPLAYGAKWDVKAVTDCTFTNTSNTGTCASGNFVAADLGKIVFGTTFPGAFTTGCNGVICGSTIISQGFLCPGTTGTTFTIGLTFPGCAADNANAACTPAVTTNCALVYGTQDDTTAINNAAAAAWTGTTCYAFEWPSGFAFFSSALLNVTIPNGSPCAGRNIADATQVGPLVYGQGAANTVLIPLPSFNFASCTIGFSGHACIAGPPNWVGNNFGVNGYGQSGSGTTHAVNLIEFYGFQPSCTATAFSGLGLSNWQAASTSSVGLFMGSGCGVLNGNNSTVEAFGNTTCQVSVAGGSVVNWTGIDCFGSSGAAASASLRVNAPGGTTSNNSAFNSIGGFYWGVNAINSAAAVAFDGSGATVYNSFGDEIRGATSGNNNFAVYFQNGGTLNLTGGSVVEETNSAGTGNSFLFFCPSSQTCNINAFNANLSANGTKMAMFLNSGTTNFKDACSNQFTQGSVANSTINVFGSCSITGTSVVAGNLVLSAGWGTTAAWSALSGSTQQTNGTITASGTGQAANPTITYTFPTPFLQTPTVCFALQVSGTQAAVANPFTPSALSKTGVTFTYNGTPGAGNTLQVVIQCWNP